MSNTSLSTILLSSTSALEIVAAQEFPQRVVLASLAAGPAYIIVGNANEVLRKYGFRIPNAAAITLDIAPRQKLFACAFVADSFISISISKIWEAEDEW